jgi:hypothetical protein
VSQSTSVFVFIGFGMRRLSHRARLIDAVSFTFAIPLTALHPEVQPDM